MGYCPITTTVNVNGKMVYSSERRRHHHIPFPMMNVFGFGFPGNFASGLGFGIGATLPYAIPCVFNGIFSLLNKN